MSPAPSPAEGGDARTDAVAQLRALYEIGRAAAQAETDDDLLRFTAAAARAALGASSVSIERFELDRGRVRVLVNEGELAADEVELPDHETYPIDQYTAARVMEDGAPGIVASLGDEDADPPELELLRDLGKHSSISVPILLEHKMWGQLYATRVAGLPEFTESDIALAQAVAAQVAAGIGEVAYVRRQAELAGLDTLTGLASRAAVDGRLAAAMAGHRADGRVVTVVICDVNGLKRLNDERGHLAGDRLLIRVGELLGVAASRLPGALAGRLGGDEFCVVAEGIGPDMVVEAAIELCRRARSLPGGAGVSCGIASTADDIGQVSTPADLVRLADGAQYRAKRGRVGVPVVAGRPLPPELARLPVPQIPGLGADRRALRGAPPTPSGLGVAEVLEEVVELLDHGTATSAVDRLAVVGDAAARLVDACAWWVSTAPRGQNLLTALRHGTYRRPDAPGQDRERYFTAGQSFDLTDYPETLLAIRGGWFSAAVDDPAVNPPERDVLVEGGFQGVVGAGGPGVDRDWLLEVFTDTYSRPVLGLGPALRALVALALSGAR